jgi:cytochrome P450
VIDRWLPGWQETAEPDYRLYIPFGMGARSCLGAAFATKLLELFLRTVLSQRVVSNPSGQAPVIAEGSVALVRRPFTLQFDERQAV